MWTHQLLKNLIWCWRCSGLGKLKGIRSLCATKFHITPGEESPRSSANNFSFICCRWYALLPTVPLRRWKIVLSQITASGNSHQAQVMASAVLNHIHLYYTLLFWVLNCSKCIHAEKCAKHLKLHKKMEKWWYLTPSTSWWRRGGCVTNF